MKLIHHSDGWTATITVGGRECAFELSYAHTQEQAIDRVKALRAMAAGLDAYCADAEEQEQTLAMLAMAPIVHGLVEVIDQDSE